jgi:hypothetical protein
VLLPLLLAQSMHFEWRDWSADRQRTSYEVAYAPAWFRPIGSADPGWARGSEIAVGARTVTRTGPFLFSLSVRPTLRILDAQSYVLSFVQTVAVGLALGPLEPDVGGGLSTLTVDSIHGQWSAELLSPRAAAGAWIHMGRFRLGVHAYGEYLWRWFGNDSYLLRGISIELGVERQPPPPGR